MSGTRSLILREIAHSGPLSRADLSKRLKIGFSIISVETAKLLDDGVLAACAYRPNASKGRKNLLLDLDESYKFAIGIGVCDSTLSAGISTVKGTPIGKLSVSIANGDDISQIAYNCICRLMRECCLDYDRIFGIGICTRSQTSQADMISSGLAANLPDCEILVEAADEYLDYGNISPDGLYMFGCAKIIRDLFLYKE